MKQYHILSLSHSPEENTAVWWKPGARGYTKRIFEAGIFSEEIVKNNPNYYNNKTDTLAIETTNVTDMTTCIIEWPSLWEHSEFVECFPNLQSLAFSKDENLCN